MCAAALFTTSHRGLARATVASVTGEGACGGCVAYRVGATAAVLLLLTAGLAGVVAPPLGLPLAAAALGLHAAAFGVGARRPHPERARPPTRASSSAHSVIT